METTSPFIVSCPHCFQNILIEKINCAIFRHAMFKNGEEVSPHLDKLNCDLLFEKKLIYGCSKPFKIIKNNNLQYEAVICEYI